MHLLDNVLCGTNDSSASRAALRYAVDLVADAGDGRVEALFVREPGHVRGRPEEVRREIFDHELAVRAWLREPWAQRARVSLEITAGDPAAAIVEEAATAAVGAIVLGSRGRVGLRRALGSVSARVARTASVPVLIVPPDFRGASDRARMRSVLCAVDLGELSGPLIRLASELAASRGASLHVLHCWELAAYAHRSNFLAIDHQRRLRAELLGLTLTSVPPDARPNVALRYGSAQSAISEAADALNADLVVMSASSRSAWGDALLGGTTSSVLTSSNVPVLVVPPSYLRRAEPPARHVANAARADALPMFEG